MTWIDSHSTLALLVSSHLDNRLPHRQAERALGYPRHIGTLENPNQQWWKLHLPHGSDVLPASASVSGLEGHLVHPVVTCNMERAHKGSFRSLLSGLKT